MRVIPRRLRRHERGAAMVEALLSMFVILLVLFGMLQVFYFFTGQLFTDYAAFRGARSRAVGFKEYLVARELRRNAIGGSGILVEPALTSFDVSASFGDSSAHQLTVEKSLIQRYITGSRWIEYEYWFGRAANQNRRVNTELHYSISNSSNKVNITARFTDYAFPDTYTKRLFFGNGIDLTGEASLSYHAQVYLED
ncbi:MAG: hypothetical protein BWY31_01050 [Lentisphaerae bacterium ADurb.Bin242]|nr:MAG: hypothetical protein BWY31_01050 [Lentisphaerae bacterium ADurb.Bin242]